MDNAISCLSQKCFLGLFIAWAALSARADQPPEILYASSPLTSSSLTANASVCDAAGNLYVTGDGGAIYLTKYDPSGNVLWTRSSGGSGAALTLDGAGGVFLTGTFPGNNGNTFTVGTNFISAYGKTMFIARYDGNGNLLWVQRGGAWLKSFQLQQAEMTVNSLARDTAGNVIVAGSFFGNPTIGGNLNSQETNGAIALINKSASFYANTASDLFLAKFAPSGALLWATNYGGTNTEYATAVAVDSTGAIYTSGGYAVNTVFGAQTYTNANEGILLAKFSSAGDLVWSSNLSDPTNSNAGVGSVVAADAADRVTFSFRGDSLIALFRFRGYNFTNTPGIPANYLSQFDSSGNLLWLQRSPFSSSGTGNGSQGARENNISVDKQNNIYLGGGGLINGGGALAIFKCDSAGHPIWTNAVPAPITGIGLGLPMVSVDDSNITHVTTTLTGGSGSALTIGWTNFYPFTATQVKNQLLFVIASNFVAVPPVFVQQPTNMVYQPPKGLTNAAQAHAWPAPAYLWFMNGSKIANQTNFSFALAPTGFTNQTTYFAVASNTYGMATSLVINAQAGLAFAPSPPTNIYVLLGTTLAIAGGASGTSAITYQWQFKGTNIANATSAILALPNMALNQSGNYTLVISNATGVLTSAPPSVVTVLPFGSIDPGYTNNFTAPVSSLARLPDGTYVAANGYNVYHVHTNGLLATNGFVIYPYRWTDGSLVDQNIGPALVLRQPDGKIIVAGSFKTYYATPTVFTNASRIARLNPDGSLDNTFNVGAGPLNTIDGTNYTKIESVIPLASGQYLVAGTFNQFNGLPITNLVRLNNDGSLDNTFPRHSFRNIFSGTLAVHSMALQTDGKLLVGGLFDVFDGVTNRNLMRLNANGTLDATFVQTTLHGTSGDYVNTVLPLPDGKIMVAGAMNFSLPPNKDVLRFNADGSRDTTWLGSMPGEVYAMTLTTSNKLIFGGNSFIHRTTYDGGDDTNFNNAAVFFVSGQFTYALVQEPGGNLMVGGNYGMRRLLLEPNVVAPTFSSGPGAAVVNGQFQFSACDGVDGQTIVVQASTDLVNWANLSTNVVSGGCFSYTDPQTPPLPNRYYRLAVLP
jgi:uncharacterized delta-60 repeat protein